MKTSMRFAAVSLIFIFVTAVSISGQRRSTPANGSGQSYARARKVLESGIAAMGGLDALRQVQNVSVKISGFS